MFYVETNGALDEISSGWHLAAFKERGRLREIFIAKKKMKDLILHDGRLLCSGGSKKIFRVVIKKFKSSLK
jgi:hypothetical protein